MARPVSATASGAKRGSLQVRTTTDHRPGHPADVVRLIALPPGVHTAFVDDACLPDAQALVDVSDVS